MEQSARSSSTDFVYEWGEKREGEERFEIDSVLARDVHGQVTNRNNEPEDYVQSAAIRPVPPGEIGEVERKRLSCIMPQRSGTTRNSGLRNFDRDCSSMKCYSAVGEPETKFNSSYTWLRA
jgi:hypothetical protein